MKKSRLTTNVIWNLLSLAIQTLASLATIPLLLSAVGEASYGLYGFFSSVLILSNLLLTALSITTARAVAADVSRSDGSGITEVSFAYQVGGVSGLVQAALIVLPLWIPGVVSSSDLETSWSIALILAGSALINGPIVVGRGILVGTQEFFLRNLLELASPVAGLVAAILMRDADSHQIWPYVLAIEVARTLTSILTTWRAHVSYPHLRQVYRWRGIPFASVAFMMKQIGNQVADVIFITSDKIVLQTILGPVSVAKYQIAERVNNLTNNFVTMPLIALVPPLAGALALKDNSYVERMVMVGTRRYSFVAFPPLIALMAFVDPLIVWWVGPQFLDSALAAKLFLAAVIVPIVFKVYSHLRLAEGTIGWMTAIKLGYAPLNLLLSILLVQPLGIFGVVLPTTIFYCLVYPVGWSVSIWRRGESKLFARSAIQPATVAAALALANVLTAHSLNSQSMTIWQALGACVISTVVSAGALLPGTGYVSIAWQRVRRLH